MKHSDAKIEQITSAQMMFNTVYTHLWNQGGPSINVQLCPETGASVTCMYRDSSGRMCAVGVLIPNEQYVPDMENTPVNRLVNNFHLPEIEANVDMLHKMQMAHDHAGCEVFHNFNSDPKVWREKLTERFLKIAQQHGLDTSVIKERF